MGVLMVVAGAIPLLWQGPRVIREARGPERPNRVVIVTGASMVGAVAAALIFDAMGMDAVAFYAMAAAYVCALLLWFGNRGPKSNDDSEVVRGSRVVQGTKGRDDGVSMQIGGVPVPAQLEAQHFLFSGTTGTGKTQAINAVLRSVRKRGHRAIIADPGGGFYSRFGQPGDVLLNPFDARSVAWSIFAELKAPYDADRLARALIPDGHGNAAEWTHYAQSLTAAVLRSMHRYEDRSIEKLVWWLTAAEPKELATLVEGTPAAALTARGNEKMLGSTRGVLSSHLGALPYLQDSGDFSVRDWVRNERGDDGWLFVTYRDDQMGLLQSLVATIIELAIVEGLSLSEDQNRGLWYVMDEVDSLGKVTSLRGGLTKLRKYGGRCILGLQTVSQLRYTYGNDEAQTLLANCSTKLILRAGDSETARSMEDELGQQEIDRLTVSKSKKSTDLLEANTSKSHQFTRQSAVMASEIMGLQDLNGYLKMPGETIHRVKLDYVSMPEVQPAFLAR